MVSQPWQALHPKILISIWLTNHGGLENSSTGQEIQLWGQSQFYWIVMWHLPSQAKSMTLWKLTLLTNFIPHLSGILKALILNQCLKYGSVQKRSVSQTALIIVNVLFSTLKKISGYGQKPKYWKIKHSNFTIWWSCSTAALLKTKDSESQLLENSIHRTAGWEQGFWQISHKHITQHVWLNSLLKLGQTQYPLKSTITRRNLGKTQTAWIVMQTEPLLFIQQKGVGKRQGREGKKWGKQ